MLKSDLLKLVDHRHPVSPMVSAVSVAPAQTTVQLQKAADKLVPLTGYFHVMAKTMTAANMLHFGHYEEAVVDRWIELCGQLKAGCEKRRVKRTYMPFLMKFASLALVRYPIVNAHYDNHNRVMIHRAAHIIGVAMDTPAGLIVPNVKNVQANSVFQIAEDLQNLHHQRLTSGISSEHLSAGTFTLYNINSIGGTYPAPVLVVQELAISTLGPIQKLPR